MSWIKPPTVFIRISKEKGTLVNNIKGILTLLIIDDGSNVTNAIKTSAA